MATMVTRTIIGTSITAKVVDKDTNEISTFTSVVSKNIEEEKDAAKALAKVIPANLVIIKVEGFSKVEKMFGMAQSDFLAHAVELDPVTRKPIKVAE